ncbi:MAG: phenylalanine--tRNA ligase subunit beta, partial [Myxococcales bacterium]
MKLSVNWISEFVQLPRLEAAEVMNRVTVRTAELEEVAVIGEHFAHVVTARVAAVRPHPDAAKLKLVRVADGLGEMEVVCGAPNVAVGQVVALAKAGTTLPSGRLEATTIRGVRSEGMICAEDELGLSADHEGVLVFPEGTPVGLTLDKLFGPSDIVLDIDNKSLTHRPDLWGHVGFAREFSALYGRSFTYRPAEAAPPKPANPDALRIDDRVPDLCPRYSALVVRNVAAKPSPAWMQQRLRSVGLRPINNIVDATNYVMLELGQPMHAFDRRQIAGDAIVIRRAEPGERFVTLDDREHVLESSDIMIADGERAVALGGVMGGKNSEIVADTTCVILESANFAAAAIRRTANRLALRTDSAMRFEKSQDPANTVPGLWRMLELLRLTCPEAEPASTLLDVWPAPPARPEILISFDFIAHRLGERLPEEQIVDTLKALQFEVKRLDEDHLIVHAPSWRAHDVTMKADVVEEIGRIYGYDNITPTAPFVRSDPPEPNWQRRFEWKARDILALRLGFAEVVNYSFTSAQEMAKCGLDPEPCLRLRNPLSQDADRLRTSLMPHVAANVALNQKHAEAFRLFEIGRTTHKKDRRDSDLAGEVRRIAGAVALNGESAFLAAK